MINTDWVNMTPHDIVIVNEEGTPLTIVKSTGTIRLVSETRPMVQFVRSMPVVPPPKFHELDGSVKEFFKAPCVIVSGIVGEWCTKNDIRKEVYGPSTHPNHTMRDAQGRIVGIMALQKYC